MSSLNVDPDGLRNTQPAFTSVASTITTAAQQLAAVIAAEGECWGGDEIGAAFAKNYTPGVEPGQQAITGLATVMTQLGTNMVTIADTFQNQDTGHAGQIAQAEGAL
ncbi:MULTISPECIES: type VII secretion target [Nocardia]|uniref:PE domain-containing protein n=1 Tax=Nocardia coubleae TaxID=356147 RepID=A0A846W7T7_9NOCA|nr:MULTISPECIES: type VII secretion target [Nocardia]MCA2210146.1 WXG100 family type VII secretion target [Nocardia rosealba]NKX88756.1 PE domain-containing protein [Nocardia coubleae]